MGPLPVISKNDFIVDGNKRVAFAATAIFLRMNGNRGHRDLA